MRLAGDVPSLLAHQSGLPAVPLPAWLTWWLARGNSICAPLALQSIASQADMVAAWTPTCPPPAVPPRGPIRNLQWRENPRGSRAPFAHLSPPSATLLGFPQHL